MIEIIVPLQANRAEAAVETLAAIDLYNVCYNAPIEITTDSNGYGYYEDLDVEVTLSVYVDCVEKDVEKYIKTIQKALNCDGRIIYKVIEEKNYQIPFETIYLENGWAIGAPEEVRDFDCKINFKSQGAFGTGLHETTRDCLDFILGRDFSGRDVLDLGTGSGILSIAASLKNAKEVTAIDLKDVREEVLYNSELNNLHNIKVIIGDVMSDSLNIDKQFDDFFINIGGEETLYMMPFINLVLKDKGSLLVSGMVGWSFDKVCSEISQQGYTIERKVQTNEWVTALFLRDHF